MSNGNDEFRGFTRAELEHHEKWMERIEGKLDKVDNRLRAVEMKAAGIAATVSVVLGVGFIIIKCLI